MEQFRGTAGRLRGPFRDQAGEDSFPAVLVGRGRDQAPWLVEQDVNPTGRFDPLAVHRDFIRLQARGLFGVAADAPVQGHPPEQNQSGCLGARTIAGLGQHSGKAVADGNRSGILRGPAGKRHRFGGCAGRVRNASALDGRRAIAGRTANGPLRLWFCGARGTTDWGARPAGELGPGGAQAGDTG